MQEKETFLQKIKIFSRKHPIIFNLGLIIVAGLLVVWLLLGPFLGFWTRHGSEDTVPSVTGLSLPRAVEALKMGGFEVEVDSAYSEVAGPGTVIEQSPVSNAMVKPGRTVYITYVCYNKKHVAVPQFYNVSRRAALAAFEGAGFENVTVREVPSEHADLVVGARYNGIMLHPGQQIPKDARIVLEVGAGASDDEGGDSYEELVLPEDADAEFIRELETEIDE